MSTDKSKAFHLSSNVSLFPMPPWQLVNKYFDASSSNADTPPRPPTPPSSAYRVFGSFCSADSAILRSLEAQGVRRVYSQTSSRKKELKKINFSILANYLDLLDIITRDPSSPKRTEKLDYLAILFINVHHLINEYRQHQARDLLREILKYQVNVSSETVEKAEQYLARTDEILKSIVSHDLLHVPSSSSADGTLPVDAVRDGLAEFGSELTPLLQLIYDEKTTLDNESPFSGGAFCGTDGDGGEPKVVVDSKLVCGEESNKVQMADHIDMALWRFLFESKEDVPMDVEMAEK